MSDVNLIISQYPLKFDIGDSVKLNKAGLKMNVGKQIKNGVVNEILLKKNPKPTVYYKVIHQTGGENSMSFGIVKLPEFVLEKNILLLEVNDV